MNKTVKILAIIFILLIITAIFIILNNKYHFLNEKSPQQITQPLKYCGTDFNCFILSAKSCDIARVNSKSQINLFGILQETDINYELRKDDTNSENCILYLIINNINLEFSEEIVTAMTNSGITIEQIDDQLEETENTYITKLIGKDGICVGNKEDVYLLLQKSTDTNYSIHQNNLDCNGSYFEQINNQDMTINATIVTDNDCAIDEDCQIGYFCISQKCENPITLQDCEKYTAVFNNINFEREICIMHIAIKDENIELCKLLNHGPNWGGGSEFDCYSKLAVLKNDPLICREYGLSKDPSSSAESYCYLYLALGTKDTNACNYLFENRFDEIHNRCNYGVDILSENPEIKIEDLMYSSWQSIAKKANNVAYCEYENWSKDRNACVAEFNN